MSYFTNLAEAVRTMQTDPATAHEPIKRMFLFDGDHLSANVSILEHGPDALHTQRAHDELVLILEGEVDFQVGEETQSVRPGDFIFIPRDTLHGPILRKGDRFAALSVFAPYFDRARKNISWRREELAT